MNSRRNRRIPLLFAFVAAFGLLVVGLTIPTARAATGCSGNACNYWIEDPNPIIIGVCSTGYGPCTCIWEGYSQPQAACGPAKS